MLLGRGCLNVLGPPPRKDLSPRWTTGLLERVDGRVNCRLRHLIGGMLMYSVHQPATRETTNGRTERRKLKGIPATNDGGER